MWSIEISKQAMKALKSIDAVWQKRIRDGIRNLAADPANNLNVKKIKGGPQNRFRLRVGDYRVVFDKEEKIKVLFVLRIGHRKEIYRSLV